MVLHDKRANLAHNILMETKVYHFILGDIHGAYDQLLRLESKLIKFAKKEDALASFISCGDLIDRGPDSKKVLEHFAQGVKKGTHQFVIGNHEIMLLEVLESYRPDLFQNIKIPFWFKTLKEQFASDPTINPDISFEEFRDYVKSMWLRQGGLETLASFNFHRDNHLSWSVDPTLLQLIFSAPFSLELFFDQKIFVITHALPTTVALETMREHPLSARKSEETVEVYREALDTLIWNREETGPPPHEHERWISGHTPFEGIKRRAKGKILQIDTGCSNDGPLTAWCLEKNRFFKTFPREKKQPLIKSIAS
jgi:hypothetical protein